VTLSGVEILQGSLIWVGFQATGHDEQYFPNPRAFDIHRENAGEHLAFGRGRHFCLGAPLARLEARVGVQVLFERLPGLRVRPGQTLEYAPTMTVSMLMHLDVDWS
jgi:cytochrome P450